VHFEERRGDLEVSTDPSRLDASAIHDFLSRSYWAEGIPRATVERSLRNSLCFGLYQVEGGAPDQIGLARVVSDLATFAYLCDVYVLPDWQGRGLGRWLLDCVMRHPDLSGVRRFTLVTRDAHEIYRAFGFGELAHPSRHLEILRRDLYRM
jgi:GNAT superfamily N-acetyltransferase